MIGFVGDDAHVIGVELEVLHPIFIEKPHFLAHGLAEYDIFMNWTGEDLCNRLRLFLVHNN